MDENRVRDRGEEEGWLQYQASALTSGVEDSTVERFGFKFYGVPFTICVTKHSWHLYKLFISNKHIAFICTQADWVDFMYGSHR